MPKTKARTKAAIPMPFVAFQKSSQCFFVCITRLDVVDVVDDEVVEMDTVFCAGAGVCRF